MNRRRVDRHLKLLLGVQTECTPKLCQRQLVRESAESEGYLRQLVRPSFAQEPKPRFVNSRYDQPNVSLRNTHVNLGADEDDVEANDTASDREYMIRLRDEIA
ncbi:hypothetical protein R6Q57_006004 [Mikania cordata]